MSKNGSSDLSTSPTRIWSLLCIWVPWTRFCSSATRRVSTSQATTFLAFSSSLTVMLPVPGPTSRTTSVGRMADFSIMLLITSGFFRMCWPSSVRKAMFCRCTSSWGRVRCVFTFGHGGHKIFSRTLGEKFLRFNVVCEAQN
uniref:Hipothetical protein n=1 Tax=Ixodes ricinus TaxID=34613 RepID=A0A0K8RA24_IXORI